MLTLKLKTGETFQASSIDERYTPNSEDDTKGSYSLNLEITPADKELEEYITILSAPTTLDSIEVTEDENPVATYTKYQTIGEAYLRVTPSSQSMAFIRLDKTIK